MALQLFPELRYEIAQSGHTSYDLFLSLLGALHAACATSDDDTIDRIFRFTHWCFQQDPGAHDLVNAAVTGFYEHIFDECRDVDRLLPHLPADVIAACWPLWQRFTPADVWSNVEKRLRKAFPHAAP